MASPSFLTRSQEHAIYSFHHGNPEIYQMNLDTRELQRMTNDSAIDFPKHVMLQMVNPLFSPLTAVVTAQFIAIILPIAQVSV